MEQKYKYSIDFYFTLYDKNYEQYFQLKSLFKDETFNKTNVEVEKNLSYTNKKKNFNDIYYNSYFSFIGDSTNSKSLSNKNFKKDITQKFYDIDYSMFNNKKNKLDFLRDLEVLLDFGNDFNFYANANITHPIKYSEKSNY